MRLFVRLTLIGLVTLTAAGFWLSQQQSGESALPKATSTEGLCEGEGTSLVVDFGTGNPMSTITRCVQNYQGNSWDLFEAAGLKITGTEKYPVGFVCRIEDFPDQKVEACIETPGTTNGSWAFYLAEDQTWKYSNYGASSHKAKCGQTEGWRFLLPGEEFSEAPRVTPVKTSCEK